MNNFSLIPARILLVEDNPGDVKLTEEALKESKITNELFVATDGVEALDFLWHRGKFAKAPCPDIILMDLNLPKKSGKEVLAEIKADKKLRRIPVIVLTVSTAEEDVLKSYDLHANSYITKPINFDQFTRIVREIENFWFTIVTLPSMDLSVD